MRKALTDSKFLGILSSSFVPHPPLFGRLSDDVNTTFRLVTTAQDILQTNHCSAGRRKTISTGAPPDLVSYKKMDDNVLDCDYFGNEFNERRASTFEDEQLVVCMLKEILEYRTQNVSSWIIEGKVKMLCSLYKCLLRPHRHGFIRVLAKDHAINHKEVCQAAKVLTESQDESDLKIAKKEEQLRHLLTPEYSWLFKHVGKLENGVKFLVDLRTDVLDLSSSSESSGDGNDSTALQQLNITLRDLLSLWFSVGFLDLDRVTWRSPCEMLQKISEYEAVHPVRSWTDLKRRVGPYRRCFVFLHSSMPGEPLVVLHTALSDEIASSMRGIVSARSRMSVDLSGGQEMLVDPQNEDPKNVKAAIFYSITSTQKGLQGIELGNYLIKKVVRELQIEYPSMTQFSSLSPIPSFKTWLMEKVKAAERGQTDVLSPEEIENLKLHLNNSDFWRELKRLLMSNNWSEDNELTGVFEKPLMRLCARYLYLEKRRGFAFDSVANFHLRNGAVMWRLNWQADLSPRGLSNSCGIMVNYRYFLEETETNSKTYLEKQIISASEQVTALADQAQKLMVVSKM